MACLTQRAPDPRASAGAIVVGLAAFSSSSWAQGWFRQNGVISSRWVDWRSRVETTSGYPTNSRPIHVSSAGLILPRDRGLHAILSYPFQL